MAKVFLSYDRDDAERARPVALALEQAGHNVWWDFHVRGGMQFSKAIEEALEAANVVVVLWSANSVESAWVRDEASVGRDTGRLIPVTINGTQAPLGFRQFQTIDLPERGNSHQRDMLFDAVESLAGTDTKVADKPAPKRARAHLGPRRRMSPWLIFGLLLLALGLLILVLGLVVSRPWEAKASVPSVTVLASERA